MEKKYYNIWMENEGDNWFTRNKENIEPNFDIILFLMDIYKIHPKIAIEIGCANGYRLAKIHDKYDSEVIGIEPSDKAINDGRSMWPFITFLKDISCSFELSKKVDLVIINFVFHWISRDRLIKSVDKINDVLGNNGLLIIGDFGTENFIKNKYHHLPDKKLFTYKQRYQDMFLATGLYKEIAKIGFNHDTGELSYNIDNSNMASVSLLKKMDIYFEQR
jgi:SAM-dependent methyltransferase